MREGRHTDPLVKDCRDLICPSPLASLLTLLFHVIFFLKHRMHRARPVLAWYQVTSPAPSPQTSHAGTTSRT